MNTNKNNDLKLRIRIHEQQLTLWEITKQTDTYIMFRASITSGKKNSDGTWDNINQTFTCFVNGEIMEKLKNNFVQRARIKVNGSLTMLPEKRDAEGRNGKYQESIFSNATINIENFEFLEGADNYNNNNTEKFSGNSEKGNIGYSSIDDDIPF